jgi:hypothetical protein
MFIDLAFVEGETFQIGGFRAGAKMRAKKDGGDYPVYSPEANVTESTSSVVVYQSGMGVSRLLHMLEHWRSTFLLNGVYFHHLLRLCVAMQWMYCGCVAMCWRRDEACASWGGWTPRLEI